MQEKTGKKSEISERISQVIDYLGVNNTDFSKKLGYQRSQTIHDITNSKSAPSFDFFNKFMNSEYSDLINIHWLITGKGGMVVDKSVSAPIKIEKSGIPRIDIEAAAGVGGNIFSFGEKDIIDYYNIPSFNRAKVDFIIGVSGSSMQPKYNSGDMLGCKIINEKSYIEWNKPHIISTKDRGILVKRIKRGSTENVLLLVSDNTEYEPFEIPKDEITGIAVVIGAIRLE